MPRTTYPEQDYAFGQVMLTLRTALRLTQAGLANVLGVSRNSVVDWEAGNKYPRTEHLKTLITYAVQHQAFPIGFEEEAIRSLWKTSYQKVLLDEGWLAALLGTAEAISTTVAPQTDSGLRPPENKKPILRLPAQTIRLIGRDAELHEIARILLDPSCRLMTLLGPGGIGKTRLALAVAGEQTHRFQDGAAFVPLEAVSTANQIISAIGDALKFSFAGVIDPAEALMSYLGEQNLLLVLDNYERLTEYSDLVSTLLQQAPQITILVTSQARLNLRSEWLFDVVGLSYPPVEKSGALAPINTQDAVSTAAVQLFLQRATQVQPTFAPSDSALMSIVHICQQVSGIPLAIELAAASVRLLPVAEIEWQIRANLDLLSANFLDSPMRQRSLRATFDYSWTLLTESEQTLLSRLAVFRGGCTAEAAQAIAGASFSSLQSLIDKSLLSQRDLSATETSQRFYLLEPTREYALEKLEASGETDKLRYDHAVYYLELAEAVTAQWASLKLDSVLEKLEREHNNMRAALQWARDTGSSLLALQLGGALWRFWRSGGYVHEARLWLDELLALDDEGTDPAIVSARQRVVNGAAWLAADQGDWAHGGPLFEQSITLLSVLGESQDKTILVVAMALQTRAKGDYRGAVTLLEDLVTRQRRLIASGNLMDPTLRPAHYCRALIAREQGDYTYAETLFQEGIDYHRMIGDEESVAQGELGVSDVARDIGDASRVRIYSERSLATYRALGIEWAIGFAMNNLALAAYLEGDLPKAFGYSSEAVLLYRKIQNKLSLAEVLITMGHILAGQGKTVAAREAFVEALRYASSLGPRILIAGALEGLAQVALQEGNATEAVKVIGGAAILRTQMGTPARPIDMPGLEQTLDTSRKILGEEAFVRIWSEAQAQPLEQLLSTIPNATVSLDSAI